MFFFSRTKKGKVVYLGRLDLTVGYVSCLDCSVPSSLSRGMADTRQKAAPPEIPYLDFPGCSKVA